MKLLPFTVSFLSLRGRRGYRYRNRFELCPCIPIFVKVMVWWIVCISCMYIFNIASQMGCNQVDIDTSYKTKMVKCYIFFIRYFAINSGRACNWLSYLNQSFMPSIWFFVSFRFPQIREFDHFSCAIFLLVNTDMFTKDISLRRNINNYRHSIISMAIS